MRKNKSIQKHTKADIIFHPSPPRKTKVFLLSFSSLYALPQQRKKYGVVYNITYFRFRPFFAFFKEKTKQKVH